MAATASQTTDPAPLRTLGAIYEAIEAIRDESTNLFEAYENDVPVIDLAERAVYIRWMASRLEDTLAEINDALGNLG